jgi:hypothetical protein
MKRALGKWTRAGVWVSTGIFAAQFFFSGVLLCVHPPEVMNVIHHLGYPDYFPRMLGLAKLLGIGALVWPLSSRLPREWAYAGFTFTCVAAFLSHALSGDAAGKVLAPLVSLALLVTSYVLRRRVARSDAPT